MSMQQAVSAGIVGERISLGSAGALGFALGGPSDPEIWSRLTPDQQMWVANTLNTLNAKIISTGSAPCPTWGPAINLAGGCFQGWYNSVYAGPGKPSKALRTDGVFDQDTLEALKMIAGMHPQDFQQPFPGTVASASKKLSTGAMVGIGAGVLAAGGLAYAAMHGGKKSRRRR